MVQIQDVIVSLDILTKQFCCDLAVCHGACCIEGDAGAPITESELEEINNLLPEIIDSLSPGAKQVIERQGLSYLDSEGERVTSIVNSKDCVFTCYDEKGCCYCAIEKAYREGRCNFMKPVSCHLYPIRVSRIGSGWGLNYNRWNICRAAILKGQKEDIPLYRFLKEPLIRRFGKDWYNELELTVSEMKRQNII